MIGKGRNFMYTCPQGHRFITRVNQQIKGEWAYMLTWRWFFCPHCKMAAEYPDVTFTTGYLPIMEKWD